MTKCPLGSPCFCQPQSGQCPCRPGATGALCDECADGFWNIGGASGCQPCNCDPANSLDNVCDKVWTLGHTALCFHKQRWTGSPGTGSYIHSGVFQQLG